MEAYGPPERVRRWRETTAPELQAVIRPDQTVMVGLDPGNIGLMVNGGVAMAARAVELRLGNIECDPEQLGGWSEFSPNRGGRGGDIGNLMIPLVKTSAERVPGGPTTLSCIASVEIFEFDYTSGTGTPVVIARFQKAVMTTVILPPGLMPVRIIRDSALSDALRSSLRPGPFDWRINDPDRPNRWEHALNFTIDGPRAPANLSYEVEMVESHDRTMTLGSFTCRKGEKIHADIEMRRMLGWPLASVDLVLKPSTSKAAAAGLPDILGGEVVLKHDAHPNPIGPQE